MQRTCRAPYGVTSSCISAEAATVLRKIQTLQNELLVAVGENVLPPRGAPAPIGGGGGAPPLLGPHRGESTLKLGGGGGRGGMLGFVSKLNDRVVNIMSKTFFIHVTQEISEFFICYSTCVDKRSKRNKNFFYQLLFELPAYLCRMSQ